MASFHTPAQRPENAHNLDARSDADQLASAEPLLAQAEPPAWHAYAGILFGWGRGQLAALGATLLLGAVVGGLAVYAFAVLASEVTEQETRALDTATLSALRQYQSPTLDLLATVASLFGSELVGAFAVVAVLYFLLNRRWGAAVATVLVTGGAQLLNIVLKEIFQRARPAPVAAFIGAQAYSFPSGHATVAIAFYTLIAYLGWRLLRGWRRVAWVALLVVLVVLVGLSRLYLGVHYLTDVIGGYISGFAWADAVIVGGKLMQRRRARPVRWKA